mgnify:CR=1 FL=1
MRFFSDTRRLELRVPRFLCYFRCELLDERTIDGNALFGFLLEPFPYSIVHVRVLWSTITRLRTGKFSFVLVSYNSLLFQNVAYLCFSTTKFLCKFVYSCQSLFSYSSAIWKRFSKGNSFLALRFVISFGMIECCGLQLNTAWSTHARWKGLGVNLTCNGCTGSGNCRNNLHTTCILVTCFKHFTHTTGLGMEIPVIYKIYGERKYLGRLEELIHGSETAN